MIMMPLPSISSTMNGGKLISLDPEGYYIEVKRSARRWMLRVQSFNHINRYCTHTVSVDDYRKLATSRSAKAIRDSLDALYGDGGGREDAVTSGAALNEVILLLELYKDQWETVNEEAEGSESPRDPTIADQIVDLALKYDVQLFPDQHNEPHICINETISDSSDSSDSSYTVKDTGESIHEKNRGGIFTQGDSNNKENAVIAVTSVTKISRIYRLNTTIIREWISGITWSHLALAPGADQVKAALGVLSAKAREGQKIYLHNRVAEDKEGNWWIDLSDDDWRAVKVTDDGWSVEDHSPTLFRRYSHQMPLYTPEHGSNRETLAQFLDYIRLTDVDHQLLYLVSQISYLVPGIPHPITLLWGGKGTIKTTSQLIVKNLFDRSSVGLISLPSPRKDQDLIQQLDHHYICSYDNVSSIDDDQSDVFCRAVTGLGVSKRQLYTDDEDVTRSFLRCVSVNGINIPGGKPDLLDRSIIYETIPIPKSLRRPLKEVEAEFTARAPRIFGAVLDVLVESRRRVKQLDLQTLNRMADFTLWGAAITEALGLSHQAFLVAYNRNIDDVDVEAVRSSTVGELLYKYLSVRLPQARRLPSGEIEEVKPKEVSFTPTELYETLTQFAETGGHSTSKGDFPGNAPALSKAVNQIVSNLPSVGFICRRVRSGKERKLTFSRLQQSNLEDAFNYQVELLENKWGFGDLRDYLRGNKTGVDTVEEADPPRNNGEGLPTAGWKGPPAEPEERSLMKDLSALLTFLGEAEKQEGGAVRDDQLYSLISTKRKWVREHFDKVLGVLMRDGTVYSPRPGFYRRTSS